MEALEASSLKQCIRVDDHLGGIHDSPFVDEVGIDTLRLTFTSNVKPLATFLILQLYYNSFYTSFEIC